MVDVHGRQKVNYVHKAKQVMRLTRKIEFEGGDTLPKGAIVYIESRNQGYNCIALKPAFFHKLRFRIRNHNDLEEITPDLWIKILNDE